MDESNVPIFRQIADLVEDSIIDGSLRAGDRAPSTNELAAFHHINPATARKGISILVEEGVLEKRRGMGMYVTSQAKDLILARRRQAFAYEFLEPLIREAVALNISLTELTKMLNERFSSAPLPTRNPTTGGTPS